MDGNRDPLEYVMNRMERAAQSDDPAGNGYGLARKELIEGIRSLRAQLAERDAQLCRAREEVREAVVHDMNVHHIPEGACHDIFDSIDAALSSTAPCSHAEEAKRLREAIIYRDGIIRLLKISEGVKIAEIERVTSDADRIRGTNEDVARLTKEAKRLRELLTLQAKRMMNTCPEPDDCDKGCNAPEEECYGKTELRRRAKEGK